jgi:hypothetical protein
MEDDMNRTVLLDPADTVILLLDHQNGLFQTVKDVPLAELRANVVVLAKAAKLANIPLITTASVPDGPNGPLMHESRVPFHYRLDAYTPTDGVRVARVGHVDPCQHTAGARKRPWPRTHRACPVNSAGDTRPSGDNAARGMIATDYIPVATTGPRGGLGGGSARGVGREATDLA